jgi:hypothetical protein
VSPAVLKAPDAGKATKVGVLLVTKISTNVPPVGFTKYIVFATKGLGNDSTFCTLNLLIFFYLPSR